jgi:hypothetical protein
VRRSKPAIKGAVAARRAAIVVGLLDEVMVQKETAQPARQAIPRLARGRGAIACATGFVTLMRLVIPSYAGSLAAA